MSYECTSLSTNSNFIQHLASTKVMALVKRRERIVTTRSQVIWQLAKGML